MVVPRNIRIESLLPATDFKLSDNPQFSQDLKVTVDRSQADPWDELANLVVKFVSTHVLAALFQFFENDFPLIGHP